MQANPQQITIIAVGPLTNLALALRLVPDIEPLVKQIVTMGGSFADADPTPEFNTQCDPEAAQIVLSASWPVRMIGLNITKQILFSRDDFASLPEWNPAITLLKACAPAWIERVTGMGWENNNCSLHDALAVSAVADPSLFRWQKVGVEVILAGSQRGVTHMHEPQDDEATVEVATAVNVEKCRHLIWQSLTGLNQV